MITRALTAMFMGEKFLVTFNSNSWLLLFSKRSRFTWAIRFRNLACTSFTKIEQIIVATPEQSWELQEELLQNCIDLWDKLGMHYEVVTFVPVIWAHSKKIRP